MAARRRLISAQASTGIAAIPAKVGKDKERVKELLRVIDYLAAPFGCEEWVFLNYGHEGVHHMMQRGWLTA